jgi:hypothetical protein
MVEPTLSKVRSIVLRLIEVCFREGPYIYKIVSFSNQGVQTPEKRVQNFDVEVTKEAPLGTSGSVEGHKQLSVKYFLRF